MAPMLRFLTRTLCLLAFLAPPLFGAEAPTRKPHTHVTLISEKAVIAPGESFEVGLLLKMDDHWHTYWRDPGPAGQPTAIEWKLPPGFKADPIRWPKPKTFVSTFGTFKVTSYGYEEEVLLPTRIHTPTTGNRPGETVNLEGDVTWYECQKNCVSASGKVSASLQMAGHSEPASQEVLALFEKYRATLDVPPDGYQPSAKAGGKPGEHAPAGATEIRTTHSNPDAWKSLADGFKVQGSNGGYLDRKTFLEFLTQPSSGSGLESRGIVAMLLLIFFGGMALNLTPCVLPLIPINLAIIGAGAQAQSRARGFFLGGIYGLGMAIAYGSLGLFVVLTGSKFGTLNASPWFNAIITVIFVVLALAMFDIITIDFARFQPGMGQSAQKAKGRFGLVFIMGAVSALLAGACVAPVVLSVLLVAGNFYSRGILAGLLLPFLLGLGMAVPWPLAGGGLSFLPKPGKWMTRVKYAFGVIILVVAGYYAYLAYGLFRGVDGSGQTQASMVVQQRQKLGDAMVEAQKTGKPVFIDFWATWCKNCTAMEATTFKDAEVKKRLEEFVVVKFQAELLQEPLTKDVLDYFKVDGLPTYVVLQPKKP